jgi:ketosteroid isomerase-like protein
MTTNNPLPAVQRMFEAFAKDDLDRLLETVHPDSRWTYVGANPWISKRLRRSERCQEILRQNHSKLDYHNIPSREFVTENDTVVVIGFESGTVTATGHRFRNEWVQKFVVQDDLITEMEEYNIQVDTTS